MKSSNTKSPCTVSVLDAPSKGSKTAHGVLESKVDLGVGLCVVEVNTESLLDIALVQVVLEVLGRCWIIVWVANVIHATSMMVSLHENLSRQLY